jgi:hypothetical protein
MTLFKRASVAVLVILSGALAGCPSQPTAKKTDAKPQATATEAAVSRGGGKIQGVNLNDPIRPAADDRPITLSAAKNEWASFSLQVSELPPRPPTNKKVAYSFRVQSLQLQSSNGNIGIEHFFAAQILPLPVDANRAGFVRHTGLAAASRPMPRALLPMAMDKGVVNLSAARDPNDPTNPSARGVGAGSSNPLLFWIDLHVPPETPAGEYATLCELFASDSAAPIASVPLRVTIHDFVLPDERHLVMTSRLAWEDLKRLYPEQFETIRPHLINRDKPEYAAAIKTLDAAVRLAQQHRTEVVVPRLQPSVKWPAGSPPEIDWTDFDTIVTPWLAGEQFADKVALNHWPMPAVDFLDRFDRKSQLQYWTQAASHFDQRQWLGRAPVTLELPVPGTRAGTAQAIQMSADAAQVLAANPNVRVTVPLEDDQLRLASKDEPNFIDRKSTHRLLATSPGIVYGAPLQAWPGAIPPPKHWLRTDVPGLVPYAGAGGDERDVRVWSWLAFLRDAGLIQWNSPLPRTSSPKELADPNDLVWFYPGEWFGVDEPLATIQLKWLRRAQQDYEYLWLARQRGQVINAMLMARLIAKPVKIQPGQAPDPTYALLTGTSDAEAWSDAQRLLARIILLREPGAEKDDPTKANELNLQVLHWAEPQDRAVLMSRTTDWGVALGGENLLNLRLGLDIYNASDARSDQNQIAWGDGDTARAPAGWQVVPQPLPVPPLQPFGVDRFTMSAKFDVHQLDKKDAGPSEITFVDGFSKRKSAMQFLLPVRASDRRQRPGLRIDGKLADWDPADAIQTAPLVRMLNRPALQKQQLQFADQPAGVYTGWADDHFYLAFRLSGVQTGPVTQTRNFVDYQFRRAWGEDLAEMLIQPVFADNSLGPVLHVVCKPAGHWIERKRAGARTSDDSAWQPFEGAAIRYTATMSGAGDWNGEVAIPWTAITDRDRGRPKMLRFNFVQHVHASGESASWAGPIDFGRDDTFMGLLYLRENVDPGVAGP